MKYLLIISALCLSTAVFGQAEKNLIKAVQNGNWDSATELMMSRVDFCINDDQDYLKKAEAITNLKEVINAHGVTSWTEIHEGRSKSGTASYSILESTTADKPLRILVFAEEEEGESYVSEIRIETN